MRISTCPIPPRACSISRVRRLVSLHSMLAVLSALTLASCGLAGESVVLEAAPTSTPADVLGLPGGTSTTSPPRTTASNAPPTTFVEPSTTTTAPPETTTSTTTTPAPEPAIERASWCDDFDLFIRQGRQLVDAPDLDQMLLRVSSMTSTLVLLNDSGDSAIGGAAQALLGPMSTLTENIEAAPTGKDGFEVLSDLADQFSTQLDDLVGSGNEACHGYRAGADLGVLST